MQIEIPTPAREVQPGQLIQVADGEYAAVLAVMQGASIQITWGDQHSPRQFTRDQDELVQVVDPATLRLTKPQAKLLRETAVGLVHFRPSNVWAPGHARHREMFELASRGKFLNRTQAGQVLDALGLLTYRDDQYTTVEPTEPAKAWLAAHPA